MYIISSRVFWSIGMFAVIAGALLLHRMNLSRKKQYPQLIEQYISTSRYIFISLVIIYVLGFALVDKPALTVERRPIIVYAEGDEADMEVVGEVESLPQGLAGYIRSLFVPPSIEMSQATLRETPTGTVVSVEFSIIQGPDEMTALSTSQFYVRGMMNGVATPTSNTAAQIQPGEVVRITLPVDVNALTPPLQLVYTFENHTYVEPIMGTP